MFVTILVVIAEHTYSWENSCQILKSFSGTFWLAFWSEVDFWPPVNFRWVPAMLNCWVVVKSFNTTASRDSSMALWSVDATDNSRDTLAEDTSIIEPIFQFSNLNSHSHQRNTSGERVRSLAYDKHNYVCISPQILFSFVYAVHILVAIRFSSIQPCYCITTLMGCIRLPKSLFDKCKSLSSY